MSRSSNAVTSIPADRADRALAHFESRLRWETDCADVHATQDFPERGFVLIDVRSGHAYSKGRLPGALNLPYREMTKQRMSEFAPDTLFVVYCAGPHCNASTRAAAQLSALGYPVKEMLGGITGWLDEGFALETSGTGISRSSAKRR